MDAEESGEKSIRNDSRRLASLKHEELISDRREFLVASLAGMASVAGCAGFYDHSQPDDAYQDGDELQLVGYLDSLERGPAESYDRPPRNVILIIPDGTGSGQISASRHLRAYLNDREAYPFNLVESNEMLNIDRMSESGDMATFPNDPDHLITDSAAAGTAMASGVKTANGVLGGVLDGNKFSPKRTVLERAYEAGMATGLVTTTRITHATPAAFAAHVPDRDLEDKIAEQYLHGGHVDVLMGGGLKHFATDHRKDSIDLVKRAQDDGYAFVETAGGLAPTSGLPLLGLFNESHMDYYLDRKHQKTGQPSLPQMTAKAIDLLQSSPYGRANGFFLMIEAGRIDHLGHGNHPGIVHEQLECDAALGKALELSGDETLIVQTADHETGGLSLGRDEYDIDWKEIIKTARHDSAKKTDLGWTTDGHTGEEVPVYARGPKANQFSGYFDNTDLPSYLAKSARI